jgi:hypothetical protein
VDGAGGLVKHPDGCDGSDHGWRVAEVSELGADTFPEVDGRGMVSWRDFWLCEGHRLVVEWVIPYQVLGAVLLDGAEVGGITLERSTEGDVVWCPVYAGAQP